ncbi:ATP-binding protein [Thermoleptolyngbya sp. M55_K2018_002]|uniref:sensor histidine kinase n=1 Tax=Thermoleptolyngbya sp. M55_K2018_002 TaxID=2747808 RepID=UPI0019DF4F45|nr:ATP-binding protein [Thermoleptolyngbya sp. M55_K2018_002]HIK41796.1 CHASE3 domain-containing protein [Thermoleptolyngbya sp. M55_K2018_002]
MRRGKEQVSELNRQVFINWSRLPVAYRGAAIAAIPATCLAIALGSWIWSMNMLGSIRRQIEATRDVITATDNVLIDLLNAETGVRGYGITRDTSYLAPYKRAKASLDDSLARLEASYQYGVSEAERDRRNADVAQIEQLVDRSMGLLDDTVNTLTTQPNVPITAPSFVGLLDEGKATVDQAREFVSQLQRQEQLRLNAYTIERSRLLNITSSIIGLTAGLSLMASTAAVYLFRQLDRELQSREQLLKESRLLLQAIVGNVVDGVVTLDEHDEIEIFNTAAEQLFGYQAHEVEGRPLDVLLAPQESLISEATRSEAAISQTTSSEVTSLAAAPPKAATSEADSSEAENSESEAANSEEAVDLETLDSTSAGFVVIDPEFPGSEAGESDVTESEVSGSEAAESEAARSEAIGVGVAGSDGMGSHALARIQPGQPHQVIGQRRDGSQFPLEISLSEIQFEDRRIAIIRDITQFLETEAKLKARADELDRLTRDLAETNEMLEDRNRELEQFAYVASHDLKAPLRAIANLSEWIEEDLSGQLPPENQQQLHLLRGRVHRMEALINGLLEYSRVGRVESPVERVSLSVLLDEVIDSIDPPDTFTITIPPDLPTLITKRLPLRQVFANLISNAVKHHDRPDGQVRIGVKDLGDRYEFSVADDGPGIAPEYHRKIFMIFQTLQARDVKESTGVGLSIVKRIVETEGGTIHLDSEEGAGTTFYFTWNK